jgi:hypothetical protein
MILICLHLPLILTGFLSPENGSQAMMPYGFTIIWSILTSLIMVQDSPAQVIQGLKDIIIYSILSTASAASIVPLESKEGIISLILFSLANIGSFAFIRLYIICNFHILWRTSKKQSSNANPDSLAEVICDS